jgi:hypothetical protein
MAWLTGPPDRALEVSPLSYQFARGDDLTDANWLIVRMTMVDGPRRWSTTDPAFLTWELAQLIGWLRDVASGVARRSDEWGGIEPLLQFEAEGSGEAVRLRALCSLEFHPQFQSWDNPDTREIYPDPVSVEFTPAVETLEQFADGLERELARFPSGLPIRSNPVMAPIYRRITLI